MTRINRDTCAVITGGARGLGLALARRLVAKNARVALADCHEQALQSAHAKLTREVAGAVVSTHVVDVSQPGDFLRLREEVVARHTSVNIVINNAGVTHYGAFEELSRAEITRVLEVNLMGVIDGCQTFLPLLREAGGGHVVNMSSMAAIVGMPRQSSYCASKAAVRAFSQSLRAELRGSGIGVTWMVAGGIGTNFLHHATSTRPAISQWLAKMLQRRGYDVDRAAQAVLRGVRQNRGEVRLTRDCEALYQANRMSPRLVGWLMSQLHRLAVRYETSTSPPKQE